MPEFTREAAGASVLVIAVPNDEETFNLIGKPSHRRQNFDRTIGTMNDYDAQRARGHGRVHVGSVATGRPDDARRLINRWRQRHRGCRPD
ncbi:MAG: hypothetical protein LC749_00115 [Actinobacteria bacterium]|nr:hypothetical protein [Actinomycetota bacterium]